MFDAHAAGGVLWLPDGQRVRLALLRALRREYRRRGFDEVSTPQIFDEALWRRSGHWDNYADDMFEVVAPRHGARAAAEAAGAAEPAARAFLKPMNCPAHCLMFGRREHSHRELPVRLADFGALHRNELSGALRGLTRLRRFCQDDAHIFCTPAQVADEVRATLDFIVAFYRRLGFDTGALQCAVSTRPANSIGGDEQWGAAEVALRSAADACADMGEWRVDDGEGAFYGPKIDVTLRDAAGRLHQCGTVQLDFQLPQRFDLLYRDEHSETHNVVMIHRAVCGSLERIIAVLAEHHAGRWPLWLAPCRAVVVPLGEAHASRARAIAERLRSADPDDPATVRVDDSAESVSKRVRAATLAHVPYVLVVGDSELADGSVAVRRRGQRASESLSLDALDAEIDARLNGETGD